MKIFVERARTLEVGFPWLYFCLRNPDIMNCLNKGPLQLTPKGNDIYKGSIFGVSISIEVLGTFNPEPEGELDAVADFMMPLALGRTYTVAHWRYRLVDNTSTLVELSFVLETHSPVMALYARLRKTTVDYYLYNLIQHQELAAKILESDDKKAQMLLSPEQFGRVTEYRKFAGESLLGATKSTPAHREVDIIDDKRPWSSELSELTNLYQNYQGRASEIEEELIRICDTRDTVATLLIARRMLELIVGRLCETKLNRKRGSEPLAGVIDKLTRADAIPEYAATSMTNLNRLSLFGAHPKTFSPRQVREALLAMCSILEWWVGSDEISVDQECEKGIE